MKDLIEQRSLPASPRSFGFFIDGQWHDGGKRQRSLRQSPGYGVDVTEITLCDADDVNAAVRAARRSFDTGSWSRVASSERGRVLLAIAGRLLHPCASEGSDGPRRLA